VSTIYIKLNKKDSRGLLISKNLKTGFSVNFHFCTCRPTKLCRTYCYARRRSPKRAKQLGTTTNAGPLTWHNAQNALVRNTQFLKGLTVHELQTIACNMAQRLFALGIDNIRWNGAGDLFEEALIVIATLAELGILVWGFTRKANMLHKLNALLDGGELRRPIFQASVDLSTSNADIDALIEATQMFNDEPRLALALMDETDLNKVPEKVLNAVKIIFGYHAMHVKTVIRHPLACPITNGAPIKCRDCQRCSTLNTETKCDYTACEILN